MDRATSIPLTVANMKFVPRSSGFFPCVPTLTSWVGNPSKKSKSAVPSDSMIRAFPRCGIGWSADNSRDDPAFPTNLTRGDGCFCFLRAIYLLIHSNRYKRDAWLSASDYLDDYNRFLPISDQITARGFGTVLSGLHSVGHIERDQLRRHGPSAPPSRHVPSPPARWFRRWRRACPSQARRHGAGGAGFQRGDELQPDVLEQGVGQGAVSDACGIARLQGPKVRPRPDTAVGLGKHDP
jgi:hypothetical protein